MLLIFTNHLISKKAFIFIFAHTN